MEMMIELISFSISIFAITFLIYKNVKLRAALKEMFNAYMSAENDSYLIRQELERLMHENSLRELSESEGFIKFISESRDWAFQYIEEVQKAFIEFDKQIKSDLEWFHTFGMVLGETPHTDVLKRISEAYDKLKEVLPENNETPNN